MTWWRTQRVALLALLLAAVATAGVHLWLDAAPIAEERESREPVYVLPDDDTASVEIGGHELTVTSTRWAEFEAPEGSITLSVRLDARSDADAENCTAFLLSETDGERVWQDAHRDVDIPFDEPGETSCRPESPAYGILAVFLLPEDAAGPFWFDVPAGDQTARFRVDP